MFINNLEKVTINQSEQWLLVRGKDGSKPLVLQIQAGPGFPMISEANTLQKLHHFEDDFLVAYWDHRGVGKSFNKKENPEKINIDQMVDDLIACTQFLLKKYEKDQAILIGYSIGATISLFAAQKSPSLFSRIFLVGVDIDLPNANKLAMEFLLDECKKPKNRKWAKDVELLKGVEINNAKLFQRRAKIMTNTGGVITNKGYREVLFDSVKHMLLSKEYRITDIFKTNQGMEFSQNAFLPEMNKLNLFERIEGVETPVAFIQGSLDALAPPQITRKYYEFFKSKSKSFTEFKHSAHLPHLEEPEKFAELIRMKVKD